VTEVGEGKSSSLTFQTRKEDTQKKHKKKKNMRRDLHGQVVQVKATRREAEKETTNLHGQGGNR